MFAHCLFVVAVVGSVVVCIAVAGIAVAGIDVDSKQLEVLNSDIARVPVGEY